jgi:hypothetical protein
MLVEEERADIDFRSWHFSELMLALADVCSQAKLTFRWQVPTSQFDPQRTSP